MKTTVTLTLNGETRRVDRFEQVVDRIHFKRLHSILIEGGRKHDLRQENFSIQKLFDYAKAVEAGHLHIKENQVGIVFANEIDGFDAVFTLGHDVNLTNTL